MSLLRLTSPTFACGRCNDFKRFFEVNLADVEASALGGCTSCSLLRAGVLALFPELEGHLEDANMLALPFRSLIPRLRAGDILTDVQFFTLASGLSPWDCIQTASMPPGHTGSDASFSTAKRWLEQCLKNHSACNNGGEVFLPTRVIDVGLSSADLTSDVKLYLTQRERGIYACLSHCWGTFQPITTKSDNIDAHVRGISWQSLPKTFKDAITFVRKLQIQYLWIDSLCIIQDDTDDWRREAGCMAEIYENAYVTLAATGAADATERCFSEMLPQHQSYEIKVNDPNGNSYQVFVRKALPHLPPVGDGHFPLLQRGWVYQERLVSRRVLHFTKMELIWECAESSDCECGSTWTAKETTNTGHIKIDHFHSLTSRVDGTLSKHWRWMVNTYSGLSISRELDRLPAFAGAAKQMHGKMPGRYLAGLWDVSLPIDLLWTASAGWRERRPAMYCAPSWSWASIRGGAYYEETVSNPRGPRSKGDAPTTFDILKIDCTTSGPDVYGEVESGRLIVSGQVIATPLLYKYSSSSQAPSKVRFFILDKEDQVLEFYVDYAVHLEGSNHLGFGMTIYCLRLTQDEHRACCLILRCRDVASQVYERIGMSRWKVGEVEKLFEGVDCRKMLTIV